MSKALISASLTKCKPSNENFDHHPAALNPFLSLVTYYGAPKDDERNVDIFAAPATQLNGKRPLQIKLATRGISPETSSVLRDKPKICELLQQLLEKDQDVLKGRNDNAATRVMLDAMPFHPAPSWDDSASDEEMQID
jgi:hypothetical protein